MRRARCKGCVAPGSDAKVLPVPAVFLTDRAGRITFTHTNPDYTKRLATKALLKAARAAK